MPYEYEVIHEVHREPNKFFKLKDILTLLIAIPILYAGYLAATGADYEDITDTSHEIVEKIEGQ